MDQRPGSCSWRPTRVAPRAGFIADTVLFGRDAGERVVQVDPVDPQTFILTTDGWKAMTISFPRPVRGLLRRVSPGDEIPRRADISPRTFRRSWRLQPEPNAGPCGTVSYGDGGMVAVRSHGERWFVHEATTDRDSRLLEDDDTEIENVLLDPSGAHAVAHVWLEVEGTKVLTSVWLTLGSGPV